MARSTNTWRRIGLIVAGVVLILAIARLPLAPRPTPDPSQVLTNPILHVGLQADRKPFAYINEQGEMIGLEVDLMRLIGEVWGIESALIPIGADGLYDAVTSNQVDVVVAGLQPNSLYDGKSVRYTRQYFDNGYLLLSKDDSPRLEGLAGKRVAVQFGSEGHQLLQRWQRRLKPFEIAPYELESIALNAFQMGVVDWALLQPTTLSDTLNPKIARAEWQSQQVTHVWYTMVVVEQRADLLQLLNDTLHTLDQDSRLDMIVAEWLPYYAPQK